MKLCHQRPPDGGTQLGHAALPSHSTDACSFVLFAASCNGSGVSFRLGLCFVLDDIWTASLLFWTGLYFFFLFFSVLVRLLVQLLILCMYCSVVPRLGYPLLGLPKPHKKMPSALQSIDSSKWRPTALQ